MIALLDKGPQLDDAAGELPPGVESGQLLTPLTSYAYRGGAFAIDNGAFAGLDVEAFRRLLERQWKHRAQCLFVAAPDVPFSARRTLEVFEHRWCGELRGWRRALVAQDGQEDLPVPWGQIDAVFIGGTTSWKLSQSAAAVVKAAKALGKWVHVGRVNTPERFDKFLDLGADSIDGTGISRFTHMRQALTDANELFKQGAA